VETIAVRTGSPRPSVESPARRLGRWHSRVASTLADLRHVGESLPGGQFPRSG